MAKRIGLITSDQARHRYLAKFLNDTMKLSGVVFECKPELNPASQQSDNLAVREYFYDRARFEERYFGNEDQKCLPSDSVKSIQWGELASPGVYSWIRDLALDVIILFGSSIVKDPLLSEYQGRIINMHLGLSPYYRGSSTNFWPLVDGMPECVGVTIHHAVLKVDAGRILAQARPDPEETDVSHDLGCKTIHKGCELLVQILHEIDEGRELEGKPQAGEGTLCKRKDFTVDALARMQRNFQAGMLPGYLRDKERRDAVFPIVTLGDCLAHSRSKCGVL